jgi:hypothetical protein
MNISKKQMMWILVAVAIFLIYWFYFRKKDTESGYKKNVPSGGNCFANKECSTGLVCRNGKCMAPVVRTPRTSTATTMPIPMPTPAPAPAPGPRSLASSSTIDLGAPTPTSANTLVDLGTVSTSPTRSLTNTLTGTSTIDGTTML